MIPLDNSYFERLKDSLNPVELRLKMIKLLISNNFNISKTARELKTTRKTIRKWYKRYKEHGIDGLKDLPKTPHSFPFKTSPEIEKLVLSLRKPHKDLEIKIGPKRIQIELKRRYGINISSSTIYKILKRNNLIKKRKKKWQKRREITEYRKRAKALKLWQVDVKYLNDIPNIYPLVVKGEIPRYEYTARDVRTGTTFVCYAYENSMHNSMKFISILLKTLALNFNCITPIYWSNSIIGKITNFVQCVEIFPKLISSSISIIFIVCSIIFSDSVFSCNSKVCSIVLRFNPYTEAK